MDKKERLFVYGTLKNSDIQRNIFGRTVNGQKDSLFGYRESMTMVGGEAFPLIIPDVSGRVEGLVLELTADDLDLADKYETDAYRRIKIFLNSGITAWVYVS